MSVQIAKFELDEESFIEYYREVFVTNLRLIFKSVPSFK